MNETITQNSKSGWKSYPVLLDVFKWLLLIGILVFLFSQLFSQQQSNADFADVAEAVVSVADMSSLQESDSQMLRRVFGMDPDDYDGVLYYAPLSNMDSTEILLVKLSDMSQQSVVQETMEARIASQISVFEGYAPDQVELLEHAEVIVSGNYLLMVVAQDPSPVVSAFRRAL